MNDKRKARIKDGILKLLNDNIASDPNKMAKELNKDIQLIKYLCEELEADELVELVEVTTINSGPTRDYLLQQTNKGIYFLSFDGGYLKRFKSSVWNRRWTIMKTIAAIINAIAILTIGFYSLYLSNKTNKLEKENDKLKIELRKMNK